MANEVVGQVSVRVVPDGTQFGPELQALLNRAQQQANQATGAISQGLNNSNKAAEQLGQTINNDVAGGLARAALETAGFTAAIYAMRSMVDSTINRFAVLFDQITKARAGFTAIIGERAGDTLLDQVREFAKETPFNAGEIIEYSQQLLGVGVAAQKIIPLLQNTGDIIASVGGDTQNLSRVLFTLTQIQTVGRLVGQDAMQLQSALIPITRYLSDYLGKTTAEIKKMQEQGAISAETVFAAISAQGEKVAGAMDASVRTIQGAREVLGDTVTMTFQDSEALQRIYQDIVDAYLAMSERLADPDVQNTIARLLDGVGDLYDALKPLIAEISGSAGTAALAGLNSFASILKVLADVIDAIPVPILESIAQVLAVMATLRAPAYFMQYVQNIQTLSGLFTPGGMARGVQRFTSAVDAQTSATRAAAAATAAENVELAKKDALITGMTGRLSRYANVARGAAQIGAMLAGQALQGQSETNVAAQTAGGALTYGAIGASFGPWGAAIGAGFGAISGFINASEAKARQHAEEMAEIGRQAALNFIEAGGFVYNSATGRSGGALDAEMDRIIMERAGLERVRSKVMDSVDGDLARMAASRVNADEIAQVTAQLEVYREKATELFGPVEDSIKAARDALSGIDTELEDLFFEQNRIAGIPLGGMRLRDWDEIEEAANRYGVSLAEIGQMGGEAFAKIVKEIDSLPDATQAAVEAANRYVTVWEEAAKIQAAIYDNQQKVITLQNSARTSARDAMSAGLAAVLNPGDQDRQYAAQNALLAAQEIASVRARAESIIATETEIERVRENLEGPARDRMVERLEATKEQNAADAGAAAAARVLNDVLTQQNMVLNALSPSMRQAAADANAFMTALAEGQAIASGVYGPQIQQQQQRISLLQTEQSLYSAVSATILDGATAMELAQLDAAMLSYQQSVLADAYARTGDLAYATAQATEATALATELASAAWSTATAEVVKLDGALDSVSGRRAVAQVQVQGVMEALAQIDLIEARLRELGSSGVGGGSALDAAARDEYRKQVEEAQRTIDLLSGKIQPTTDRDREILGGVATSAAAMLPEDTAAKKIADEAERAARELAQKMEQASNSLETAIENAAQSMVQAAEAWKGNIKEATQYEAAVSANRALRNTNRQISDITELNAGFQALKAAGLSEAALTALDINSITDLRQVRKLLRSDPAQLAALSAAVEERDRSARELSDSRVQEQTRLTIVQAIVAAAEILGYAPDSPQVQAALGTLNADITITTDNPEDALAQLMSALSGGTLTR